MFESGYDILTTENVMELLNIGKNALYKLLASGKLKAFRIGRNWKIPRKSVDEYIDDMVK